MATISTKKGSKAEYDWNRLLEPFIAAEDHDLVSEEAKRAVLRRCQTFQDYKELGSTVVATGLSGTWVHELALVGMKQLTSGTEDWRWVYVLSRGRETPEIAERNDVAFMGLIYGARAEELKAYIGDHVFGEDESEHKSRAITKLNKLTQH